MYFSVCRAWSSLFLSTLQRLATLSSQYLPPGHSCAIDYPVKVKPNGAQSRIYSHVHTSSNQGPFYTVDVSIVGCYGVGKFLGTTFVVPSMEPLVPLHEYGVEYDTSLGVYIVQQIPKTAQELPSLNQVPTSTEEETDADEWFDAEYIGLEGDDEDWETYDDHSDVLGIFCVENFPVMSRLDISAPKNSSEGQDIDLPDSENIDFNECKPETHTVVLQVADLLRPERFDRMDEVEGEGEMAPYQATEQPIENQETDLLKYEDFDWAEEVEEEEAIRPRTMKHSAEELATVTEMTGNKRVEDNQPWPASGPVIVSSIQGPPGRPSSPLPFERHELQEAGSLALDAEDQNCAETGTTEYPDDQADDELKTQAAVWYQNNCSRGDWEWASQHCQTENDPNIHHFNWLGFGVFGRSETPPEVSLAVILSAPKVWFYGNPASREATILRQAFSFVDPVLYEGGMEALYLRGSALQRAVTGFTSKFYTSYGTWVDDTYGRDDDRPTPDPIDVDIYQGQTWYPINGWYDRAPVPTREAELCKSPAYEGKSAWEFSEEKSSRQYRMSPLRNSLATNQEVEPRSQSTRNLRIVRGSMQYWAHGDGRVSDDALSDEDTSALESDDEREGRAGLGGIEPRERVDSGVGMIGYNDRADSDANNKAACLEREEVFQTGQINSRASAEDLYDDTFLNNGAENTDGRIPDQFHSSTETSEKVLPQLIEAMIINVAADDKFVPAPVPLPENGKTVIHTVKHHMRFQEPTSVTVMNVAPSFPKSSSCPSLIQSPPAGPKERDHPPTKPAAANPTTKTSSDKKPKAKYVRLEAKSAPAQPTVSIESEFGRKVPEFSIPDKEINPNGRKKKRIWKRAWSRVSKTMKKLTWSRPPTPPPPPEEDPIKMLLEWQLRRTMAKAQAHAATV